MHIGLLQSTMQSVQQSSFPALKSTLINENFGISQNPMHMYFLVKKLNHIEVREQPRMDSDTDAE